MEVLLPFLAAGPEEAIKSYEPASACKNMTKNKQKLDNVQLCGNQIVRYEKYRIC